MSKVHFSSGAKWAIGFLFLGLVACSATLYVVINDVKLPSFDFSESDGKDSKGKGKAKRKR